MRRHSFRWLAALTALVLIVASCDTDATYVATPSGSIVDGPTATVTGDVPSGVEAGGTVTVNGVIGTWTSSTKWSAQIPMDTTRYVTPVTSIYTAPNGFRYVQKTSLLHGPKIDDGQYSPNGVGMYFTNHGLEGLGPVINSLASASFDISTMIPPGTELVSNVSAGSGVTITKGTAYEAGAESIDLATHATTGGVKTAITVKNLYLGIELQLSGIISGSCKLEVQIPSTAIDATFDLAPGSPADQVDVNMVGAPTVSPSGLKWEFISGPCDPSTVLIGSIVNSQAAGAISGSITSGFVDRLADPDGSGPLDSPIADAIETALAGISIAGSVGDAVQAHLDAPFTRIDETAGGIDFRSNADFSTSIGAGAGQCQAPADAPTFTSSMDVPGTYPTLGDKTPGGLPYGLGLVISSSTFNQLLSSMTQCGLLNQELTELNFGGNPLPINSSILSLLIPQFGDTAKLPANTPLKIRIDPQAAPFITPAAHGPNGEPAELYLPDLHIDFVQTIQDSQGHSTDKTWLSLGVDAPLGFQMGYDATAGQLAPTITPPTADKVTVRVLSNAIGADAAGTATTFSQLFPSFVSDLGAGFGAFPLPSFLGLSIDVVEIARVGTNYWTLFADLNPAPQTRLGNVTVTDSSSADYSVDKPALDSYEWRHRLRKTVTPDSVNVKLAGVIGADACCTVHDAFAEANVEYRVDAQVLAEPGANWRLDMTSLIRGAHRGIAEGFGAQSNISKIGASYQLDNGAWNDFSFDVGNGEGANPSETTPWQGGWSGATFHEPFAGNATRSITGSGSHLVSVVFKFHVQAWSDSNAAFPAKAGNESAIVFGANDSLANGFTAGEYPGLGNRNILTDGHFGTIKLTPLP